jgi:hypothetical protein
MLRLHAQPLITLTGAGFDPDQVRSVLEIAPRFKF